ncbi:DMT family transporter [Gloeocapsa sp. PCC 73106]|uniref:DMT family transporter n=1 Tax=Gloeocapsa sp. PCC 73106 TaxID=102232 RepID=UPI0002AC42BB|nr:DMT family transporter [Gloeocapsa sp. PCC 73106]ELR98199.1 putative membrane protein [Gloeocapsa sp. PCC 73106]
MENFTGELAALSAAGLWALSSLVYGLLGAKIPPLRLNLYKGLIAIALIGGTLLLRQELLPEIKGIYLFWLLLSGATGLGLGDTAYFYALNHLGARRALLLETLSPPLVACLAWLWLGETLSYLAWCGMLLTLLGVAWVISERTIEGNTPSKIGLVWGVIAALSQATGAVISRYALVSESNISPLASTLIRLIGGTLIISPLLVWRRTSGKVNFTWSWRLIGVLILTAWGSTYLGIWLQQTALKYTQAGVATTLLGTSPLFILPIARIMGEKVTLRACLGGVVAIAGIALLSKR